MTTSESPLAGPRTEPAALMAWALAALYLAGATVGALTLVLPHPGHSDTTGLWSNVAIAAGGGAAVALAARWPGLRPWMLQLVTVTGTLLITRAVILSHDPGTFYNLWYVWIGLYAFYFFGRGWGWAHVALVGLAYAYGLSEIGATSPLARWVMTITTIAIAAVLIDTLAGRARRGEAEANAALRLLDEVARTDELTGLANRRAWDEHLTREIARARRGGTPLAVAMLDLDNFKAYNDHHGHQGGDRLLKEAAATWLRRLRATDVLARYGGEEFALALPGARLGDSVVVLDQLRAGTPAGVRSSAGVAEWDREESGAELLARADQALYEAKRLGRDRVVADAA